jgi:hypothetical protein
VDCFGAHFVTSSQGPSLGGEMRGWWKQKSYGWYSSESIETQLVVLLNGGGDRGDESRGVRTIFVRPGYSGHRCFRHSSLS